jgi:DNA-binding response OmpR family regulator
MEAVRIHRPTLVLLDVMLPGLSGYDICKQLRAKKVATPILMLTAKGQEIDKVVGLDLGADDYVTKPFGVRELLARIHALLRRTAALPSPETDTRAPFQIGAATVDPKTFQLNRGKTVEELTAKELKLLQLFAAHPGEVFSRDRLLNEVWATIITAPRARWTRSSSNCARSWAIAATNPNTSSLCTASATS